MAVSKNINSENPRVWSPSQASTAMIAGLKSSRAPFATRVSR